MEERFQLAASLDLPTEVLLQVSSTYTSVAERITGKKIELPDDPRSEIIHCLDAEYGLIQR
jgi:phosphoribosylaminoimidazole-succinocarboxamide synthase